MADPLIQVRFLRRTHRILDATDSTEYNNLSDSNKEAYGLIISCGYVDLAVDSPTRIKLWNMFGEGTTTRTNLEDLLPSDGGE